MAVIYVDVTTICLYCVRGVWKRATCQYPTYYMFVLCQRSVEEGHLSVFYILYVCIVSEECGGGPLVSILHTICLCCGGATSLDHKDG